MTTTTLPKAPRSRFALPAEDTGVLDAEARELLLANTRALLSPPTAPYAEDAMVAVVREFAERVPGIEVTTDRWQNLSLLWPGKGRRGRGPHLAYSAHLDHPGFLWLGRRGGVPRASFHGGVPESWFPGSPVRFFDPDTYEACATARVARTSRDREKKIVAELEEFEGRARRGMFGMWDLTAGSLSGTRFRARVCDDLIGAAALLTTLELLANRRHPAPLLGIFTRAEETGFVGCQGLLRSKSLAKNWSVIGLECSPKRSTAKVGEGPVIRVGDAGSIFEPGITHLLQEVCADLQRTSPGFSYQRALMDGGRCESSAYNLWGVPAGALCLALGNYHNRAPNGRIAPEYVDWNDYEGLVALMVGTAERWRRGPASEKMKKGLDRVWKQERERLQESARRIRAKHARTARR